MDDPLPKCDAATCTSKKHAVVFVEGYHDNLVTKQREAIRLNLCAECAGPLMKSGKPISVGGKWPSP